MNFEDAFIFAGALFVALIVTGLMALMALPAVRRALQHALSARRFKQSGNVFFMLFGAVAIAGLIGVSTMTTMKGPTRGITHSNQVAAANNTLYTTARMIAGAVQAEADCDSDGIVEPPPWRDAGGLSAPSGGGLVPTDLGATQRDPWGSDIGYCAWDHGRRTVTHDVAACGGAGANRLVGADSKSEYVIAVISAGPDRLFQTTCNPWVDADDDGVPDTPLIVTPAGSDDIVRAETITALFAEGSTNQLQHLPDEACTPDAIGTLRYDAGTMQVCREGGWQEVGSGIQVSGNFLPVTGAQLNSEHTTSNGISFTGFFGTRTATVDGGAVLIVNGVEQGNAASIVAGDTIELKATAAGIPATTSTFTLSVSTLRRAWTITTRDPTPPALVMTPASNSAMNVTGPGSPAHGATVRFTVRNTGETPTVALGAAQLSNTTHFAFDASGANVGDGCQGQVLAHNATCFIDVRPRASDDGTYSGTLSIAAGSVSDDSALSGTATGWTCTVASGTTWTVAGKICTVPTTLTIASGSTAVATDSIQPTTGSATYSCSGGTATVTASTCVERCTVAAGATWAVAGKTCTAPSALTINHGATATSTDSTQPTTGTATYSCNNGTASVTTSSCVEQCSVASGTTWTVSGKTCTAPSALTINHGATATSTDSTQPTTGTATYSCNSGTASVTTSSCTESCAANQTVNWAPGCSALSGALLANGEGRTITNTASGYDGTRDITCNNGTLAQNGGSCTVNSVNEWTQVASIPLLYWERYKAAPLADGRVLICGGEIGVDDGEYITYVVTNRCDIYNPATNTFTQVANMPQAKVYHSAAPLAGGRVLICGGTTNNSTGGRTARCDIYNPATNTFAQAANMPTAKFFHNAAPLAGGRVLICGGSTSMGGCNISACDIYDAVTNTFTSAPNIPVGNVCFPSAAPLADGRALFCGGNRSNSFFNRCDIYNPATNTFTQAANMPQAKREAAAALLVDGRVLICGGTTVGVYSTNRCDIYNPATDSFAQVANLPVISGGPAAAPLADGRVLLCGVSGGGIFNRCYIYTP